MWDPSVVMNKIKDQAFGKFQLSSPCLLIVVNSGEAPEMVWRKKDWHYSLLIRRIS